MTEISAFNFEEVNGIGDNYINDFTDNEYEQMLEKCLPYLKNKTFTHSNLNTRLPLCCDIYQLIEDTFASSSLDKLELLLAFAEKNSLQLNNNVLFGMGWSYYNQYLCKYCIPKEEPERAEFLTFLCNSKIHKRLFGECKMLQSSWTKNYKSIQFTNYSTEDIFTINKNIFSFMKWSYNLLLPFKELKDQIRMIVEYIDIYKLDIKNDCLTTDQKIELRGIIFNDWIDALHYLLQITGDSLLNPEKSTFNTTLCGNTLIFKSNLLANSSNVASIYAIISYLLDQICSVKNRNLNHVVNLLNFAEYEVIPYIEKYSGDKSQFYEFKEQSCNYLLILLLNNSFYGNWLELFKVIWEKGLSKFGNKFRRYITLRKLSWAENCSIEFVEHLFQICPKQLFMNPSDYSVQQKGLLFKCPKQYPFDFYCKLIDKCCPKSKEGSEVLHYILKKHFERGEKINVQVVIQSVLGWSNDVSWEMRKWFLMNKEVHDIVIEDEFISKELFEMFMYTDNGIEHLDWLLENFPYYKGNKFKSYLEENLIHPIIPQCRNSPHFLETYFSKVDYDFSTELVKWKIFEIDIICKSFTWFEWCLENFKIDKKNVHYNDIDSICDYEYQFTWSDEEEFFEFREKDYIPDKLQKERPILLECLVICLMNKDCGIEQEKIIKEILSLRPEYLNYVSSQVIYKCCAQGNIKSVRFLTNHPNFNVSKFAFYKSLKYSSLEYLTLIVPFCKKHMEDLNEFKINMIYDNMYVTNEKGFEIIKYLHSQLPYEPIKYKQFCKILSHDSSINQSFSDLHFPYFKWFVDEFTNLEEKFTSEEVICYGLENVETIKEYYFEKALKAKNYEILEYLFKEKKINLSFEFIIEFIKEIVYDCDWYELDLVMGLIGMEIDLINYIDFYDYDLIYEVVNQPDVYEFNIIKRKFPFLENDLFNDMLFQQAVQTNTQRFIDYMIKTYPRYSYTDTGGVFRINIRVPYESIDMKDLCSVCLQNNCNFITKCNHTFCMDCIKSWMEKKQTCPICRSVISLSECKQNVSPNGYISYIDVKEEDDDDDDDSEGSFPHRPAYPDDSEEESSVSEESNSDEVSGVAEVQVENNTSNSSNEALNNNTTTNLNPSFSLNIRAPPFLNAMPSTNNPSNSNSFNLCSQFINKIIAGEQPNDTEINHINGLFNGIYTSHVQQGEVEQDDDEDIPDLEDNE